MRTKPIPTCLLCGSAGTLIHEQHSDRLFGTEGAWNTLQCPDPACRLMWLDPAPVPGDLHEAYSNYYTHETVSSEPQRRSSKILRLAEESYLASACPAYVAPENAGRMRARYLVYLDPVRRRNLDLRAHRLNLLPMGRLLDVGCGAGDWMSEMRGLGWAVEGVEFDPAAVSNAQSKGLSVSLGSLEEQSFPDDSFDAINLFHVIEHLPDPINTLRECRRVLKPHGVLMVSTPNSASLSHRIFGVNWRGLEPPMHLHLFSPQSLTRVLRDAGFTNVVVQPQIVRSVILESIQLWCRGRFKPLRPPLAALKLAAAALSTLEALVVSWRPGAGDCLSAVAN